MSQRKYFISFNPFYLDPTTGEIVKNPHTMEHFSKYSGEIWVRPDEPMRICEGLKLIDGTLAAVENGMTGNTMFRNCETGEIEEMTFDDDDE